jgi:DNA-directed RNA polymerase subunit K/omega
MAALKQSRTLQLDLEKCVENSGGNRYFMIVMAAARSREIASAHKKSEATHHIYPVMDSLFEFQNGVMGPEAIRKVR